MDDPYVLGDPLYDPDLTQGHIMAARLKFIVDLLVHFPTLNTWAARKALEEIARRSMPKRAFRRWRGRTRSAFRESARG